MAVKLTFFELRPRFSFKSDVLIFGTRKLHDPPDALSPATGIEISQFDFRHVVAPTGTSFNFSVLRRNDFKADISVYSASR